MQAKLFLKGIPKLKRYFKINVFFKNYLITKKYIYISIVYSENKAPGSFQSASGVQMKVHKGSIESA